MGRESPNKIVVERLHACWWSWSILTTGVGTILENEHEKVVRNGREYLI